MSNYLVPSLAYMLSVSVCLCVCVCPCKLVGVHGESEKLFLAYVHIRDAMMYIMQGDTEKLFLQLAVKHFWQGHLLGNSQVVYQHTHTRTHTHTLARTHTHTHTH